MGSSGRQAERRRQRRQATKLQRNDACDAAFFSHSEKSSRPGYAVSTFESTMYATRTVSVNRRSGDGGYLRGHNRWRLVRWRK